MARILRGASWLVTVAALAGCASGGAVDFAMGHRDYSVDPSARYQRFDFGRLVQTPQQGLECAFTAMFDRHDEKIWQPFYTSFSPEDFVSFSAWPPNARVWEIKGRQSSVPTLFFRKTGPHLDQLMHVQRYQLVELRGVVRSTFEGRPWIEVYYVLPITGGPIYSDRAVRHLFAGMTDAEANPASAIKNIDMAIATGELPDPALAGAYAKLGDIYSKRAEKNPAEWERARDNYEQALEYGPMDKAAREGYDHASMQAELYQRKLEEQEAARAAAEAARAEREAGREAEATPEPTPEPSPEPTPEPEPEPTPMPPEEEQPVEPE